LIINKDVHIVKYGIRAVRFLSKAPQYYVPPSSSPPFSNIATKVFTSLVHPLQCCCRYSNSATVPLPWSSFLFGFNQISSYMIWSNFRGGERNNEHNIDFLLDLGCWSDPKEGPYGVMWVDSERGLNVCQILMEDQRGYQTL